MPSDERGLYIKVYPDELRALIQRCELTYSEIGTLLVLALRINSSNRCFPSQTRLAADMGGKGNRTSINRILRHLREKGALDWTRDADKQANIYLVPLCFSFGSLGVSNENRDVSNMHRGVSKSTQGGVSKSTQGGVSKSTQGGVQIRYTEQNTEEQESVFNKIQTEQHSGQPSGLALKPEGDPANQILLIRALLDSDVDDREAFLLVQQFDPQTIKDTIKTAEQKSVSNKGGWIRSVIERKTGKVIQYPGQQHSTTPQRKNRQGESAEFHKQLTAAIKSARALSRYEADPYFRQFEDQEVNQT